MNKKKIYVSQINVKFDNGVHREPTLNKRYNVTERYIFPGTGR